MVLNDLLDLSLKLRVDVTLRNLAEERSLALEVLTEVSLPLGDLVDGDAVELDGPHQYHNSNEKQYE